MIADCTNPTTQQTFDAMGLVKTIIPTRSTRHFIDIISGSMTHDQARTMPLTAWTDNNGTCEPPLSFFCLSKKP